ncbi:MAG: HAD-IC family P-type ATPase [Gemmatimonadaceae bacterium]
MPTASPARQAPAGAYWSRPLDALLADVGSASTGLSSAEAARRLASVGPNSLQLEPSLSGVRLLFAQVKNPLVLILIFAATISAFVGEYTDAGIVLVVVVSSALLGFVQEFRANHAVAKLRAQVTIATKALRDGRVTNIPSAKVVPGDVILLSAGSLIPADGVVLEATDFFVNQSVLTGESFPAEKSPGVAPEDASLSERTNCVFTGTNVRSGSARLLAVETGAGTVFGRVAERLNLRPPQTEFERGLQSFGYLLTRVMVVMVLVVLTVNLISNKPVIDSLLFALALAVGLTPELLPAIVSITLSHGAQKMAGRGVIVRRLNSIENLGSMDVLCTDKTGTLTLGVLHLDGAMDLEGRPSPSVLPHQHHQCTVADRP